MELYTCTNDLLPLSMLLAHADFREQESSRNAGAQTVFMINYPRANILEPSSVL